MKPAHLLLTVALLLTAGCTGLPAGSADFGDTVTVRYTVEDANGTVLRPQRSATFVLGSGASGLGLGFERGLRGAVQGENVTFTVDDDPSLRFGKTVEVDRDLPSIQSVQDAPRSDFEANVGPATVGQTFPAFGIYTATVTGFTATRVNFTITAQPGQRDPVPAVGAALVSDMHDGQITRRLEPDVGATFTINPPSPASPQTPLGLEPGTYRTLGATGDMIQYGYSTSSSVDLIGKDLRFRVTVVRLVGGDAAVEPVCEEDGGDCNYAARRSPYVNGDPESVLAAQPAPADDGHDDEHGH